jgi:hypothetical protein
MARTGRNRFEVQAEMIEDIYNDPVNDSLPMPWELGPAAP